MVRALLFLLLVAVVFLLVIVFAWQNPGDVTLNLLFADVTVSRALAFAVAIAAGWVWGLISALAYIARLVGERRTLRKRVRLAEMEIKNLRSLPMHDAG